MEAENVIIHPKILNAKCLVIPVGDKQLLHICTGTAEFDLTGKKGNGYNNGTLVFPVGHKVAKEDFIGAGASANLGSISNDGTATDAAWAVDLIEAVYENQQVSLKIPCAVRDVDGHLYRVNYVAFIQAKV